MKSPDECETETGWFFPEVTQEELGQKTAYISGQNLYKLNRLVSTNSAPKRKFLKRLTKLEDNLLMLQAESLFKTGKTFYFSDLAEALQINLEAAVNLAKKLMRAGKIKVDGSTR